MLLLQALTIANEHTKLIGTGNSKKRKLAELEAAGINPYPAPPVPGNALFKRHQRKLQRGNKEQFANVCLAGRIMSINDKGKVFL